MTTTATEAPHQSLFWSEEATGKPSVRRQSETSKPGESSSPGDGIAGRTFGAHDPRSDRYRG